VIREKSCVTQQLRRRKNKKKRLSKNEEIIVPAPKIVPPKPEGDSAPRPLLQPPEQQSRAVDEQGGPHVGGGGAVGDPLQQKQEEEEEVSTRVTNNDNMPRAVPLLVPPELDRDSSPGPDEATSAQVDAPPSKIVEDPTVANAELELEVLEIKMDCDQLVLQITRMKNLQKEIEEKTREMEVEFTLQIEVRRGTIQANNVPTTATLEDEAENSLDVEWEIWAVRQLDEMKMRISELKKRYNSLLSQRSEFGKALENVEMEALAPQDNAESDGEVRMLMKELALERACAIEDCKSAEQAVDDRYSKAILYQHDRVQLPTAEYDRLREDFARGDRSLAEESQRIVEGRKMDDATPISLDTTRRPRTTRELKSRILSDLMRL